MEELPRRVDRKRWRLLMVKGAQPAVILRARLLELHVVAHHADNVRLLPHRLFEVVKGGHEVKTLLCAKISSYAMRKMFLGCDKDYVASPPVQNPDFLLKFRLQSLSLTIRHPERAAPRTLNLR